MRLPRIARFPAVLTAAVTAILSGALTAAVTPATAATAPTFDHILVVLEENHSAGQVVGSSSAPYLNSLAAGGASMTQSYGVTHPSQPNYLALFSGSTQGITDDSCPHTFSTENLAHQLAAAGLTFAGYSETMPTAGYTGCTSGRYARKHNPWANFSNVPASSNLRFADLPTDYSTLPKVSFVVPNLCNDMHDCSVATGDTWLKNNLGAYATWAATHNSLLLVTFDEDNSLSGNRIPTIFSGAHVAPGSYPEKIDHYSVLRTLETLTGIGCVASSCTATPITDIWN